jgi:hypothetical protein
MKGETCKTCSGWGRVTRTDDLFDLQGEWLQRARRQLGNASSPDCPRAGETDDQDAV